MVRQSGNESDMPRYGNSSRSNNVSRTRQRTYLSEIVVFTPLDVAASSNQRAVTVFTWV
jgi:hypothetical protein